METPKNPRAKPKNVKLAHTVVVCTTRGRKNYGMKDCVTRTQLRNVLSREFGVVSRKEASPVSVRLHRLDDGDILVRVGYLGWGSRPRCGSSWYVGTPEDRN